MINHGALTNALHIAIIFHPAIIWSS